MKEKELVIDRKIWLRGESNGKLLTHDRKAMCCLGIYMNSCGVSREKLRSLGSPECVIVKYKQEVKLPEDASWLYKKPDGFISNNLYNSDLVFNLMSVNDNFEINEKEREEQIRDLFAKADVKVKFVGKGKPQR